MKQVMTACMVVLAVLAWTGGLTAHHSLVRFDTTKILWVKGTVVRFDLVNPHVRFVLEQTTESGQTQRWVVDGPSSNQLARLRIGPDFLKAGDRIEVCGVAATIGLSRDPATGLSHEAFLQFGIAGRMRHQCGEARRQREDRQT